MWLFSVAGSKRAVRNLGTPPEAPSGTEVLEDSWSQSLVSMPLHQGWSQQWAQARRAPGLGMWTKGGGGIGAPEKGVPKTQAGRLWLNTKIQDVAQAQELSKHSDTVMCWAVEAGKKVGIQQEGPC